MTATESTLVSASNPVEPFDDDDVSEFRHEDAHAGKNIGLLLVAFFIYSLFAMMFVTWWAFSANVENTTDAPVGVHSAHDSHAPGEHGESKPAAH